MKWWDFASLRNKELSEADCLIRATQQSNLVKYFKELFNGGIVTFQGSQEEQLAAWYSTWLWQLFLPHKLSISNLR